MAQQPAGSPVPAELEIALHKLNVLGSVLYVGAHPDDENTAVLAYLSKGRKYRTAYLSVTRGEGGQNLIGPEQGAEIGLIRTQELLAARRIDGAEQYFTRAVDFGYSKTAEEILRILGEGKNPGRHRLGDPEIPSRRDHHPVRRRELRRARPPHGLRDLDPGSLRGRRRPEPVSRAAEIRLGLEGPAGSFGTAGAPSQAETETCLRVDTGEYNPLLGKSYSEIAGESRSQHKSQGFGSAGRRGAQYDYFRACWPGSRRPGHLSTGSMSPGIASPADKRSGSSWPKACGRSTRSIPRNRSPACWAFMPSWPSFPTKIGSG